MQHAQFWGAVHALILIALTWRSVGHLTRNVLHRLCSVFLLAWCNLVYTALILSAFSILNSGTWYFSVSLILSAGLEIGLYLRNVSPHDRKLENQTFKRSLFDGIVHFSLAGFLLLAAVATFLICIYYLPTNGDTLSYRLSRPFFYLAQGNLLNNANPDPRLSFYPFNGSLLYLFLAVYQFSARWFNLIPALFWTFAGVAVYSASRSLGGSRTGSFVGTWICLISPIVLVQGASGNDELLAAVPILMGLGLAVEWIHTGKKRYALLAAIGMGLGFGTKLHWIFYSVFCAFAVLLVIVYSIRRQEFRARLIRSIPAMLLGAAIAVPLSIAFILCNYISSGKVTSTEFNNQVMNTPFRLSLAGEKIWTSNAELFLSPIPDLVPPVDRDKRQQAYAAFNKFFMQCCFSDLTVSKERSLQGYIFQGPADPAGYLPSEGTVWLGLLPHLLLLVCVAYLFTRKLPISCMAFVAGFFFWHFTYALQTRYIAWTSTYYCFPAVLAAAGIGPIWDFARSSRGVVARCLLAGFVALFATHMLLASNLLVFGGARNVQSVWQSARGEASQADPPVEASITRAIQSAQKVYIPYTHWEILYWNFMRLNPAARYTTGLKSSLPSPDTMMLLSIPPTIAAGTLPARLPPGSAPGLTHIGTYGMHLFAQGGHVDTLYPDRSRYALVPITWKDFAAAPIVTWEDMRCCIGLEPSDGVELRYIFQSSTTGRHLESKWSLGGAPVNAAFPASNEGYDSLVIETRAIKNPDSIVQTVYNLGQPYYVVGENERALDGESPSDNEPEPASAATTVRRSGTGSPFLTDFDAKGRVLRSDFNGFVGMKLTVGDDPLYVPSVGRFCLTGNSGTHIVKFVNANNGTDVRGGAASLNMAGCTPGQFKYVPLTNPIMLSAKTAYFLVSQEASGGDRWYDFGRVTPTDAAVVNDAVYSRGMNWLTANVPGTSFVPPNFLHSR